MAKSQKDDEVLVYSFRVSDEVEIAIREHMKRLAGHAWTGMKLTRTDAITNLIFVGSIAWEAVDCVGAANPGVIVNPGMLIDAGERAFAQLSTDDEKQDDET